VLRYFQLIYDHNQLIVQKPCLRLRKASFGYLRLAESVTVT